MNKWSKIESIRQISPDWQIISLQKFSSLEKSAFVNGPFGSDLLSSELVNEGMPVIYIRDIKDGRYNRKSEAFITAKKYDSLPACQVHQGDVVISKVGDPPCEAAVYDSPQSGIVTQDVIRIKTACIERSQFLAFLLNSDIGKRQVKKIKIAGTRERVSLTDFKKLKFPSPSLPEQKKIAQILSIWDKAITTTEQLLANSQQQKKALMQQLLTGKKRLGIPANSYEFRKTRYGIIPKDWEYPAIKDICAQMTEKNTESADYPVLSCSKYDGFVDSLSYFKKKVYSDDTSGYRLIHRGCFGFPSNHVEEGSIGLQNLYETGIVSPIYVVFRAKPEKVDNTYLYAVLKTDHYRQIFGAATNASVDRRGSLRWKEFSLIHVPLPPLEEQQKIATVLSSADQEISTLGKKLDALRQEKKALMQQLLTGKRRVLINK